MPAPAPVLKFLTNFAIGGTERQFVYIAKGIDKKRFNVQVGCLARRGEFLKDLEASNFSVSEYRITSLFSPGMLLSQWRFARDLRRRGIRLVHAYGFYPNVFSVPAAHLAGCITIASVRDTGAFSNRVKLKTLWQKTACRLADRVIANSSAVRNWLISIGLDENNIDVIPNGIKVEELPQRSPDFPIRRGFGLDPSVPLIAVVSRLDPRKGIEYFLQGAATLAARFPAAQFLVVGPALRPEYRSSLERLARNLNLTEKVRFTGERNDVRQLLKEIDLAVLPSLSEGFSNSLLEAMAAGLPVVATDVGGNPEIVENGKTGFLVRPNDAQAIGDAMAGILGSPEIARRFGEAGFRRVAERFSIATTVRKTEDLYSGLLEQQMWRHARPVRAS